MIVQFRPPQQVESYWHQLATYDPKGHLLTPLRVDVSKYGNLRLTYVCVECGCDYFEVRNFQDLTNSACQFDMLQIDPVDMPEPIVVNLVNQEEKAA